MPREATEQLVVDLLQDQWDKSNTYSLTPKITFGYFDSKDEGQPAVTVPQPTETPVGGGNTGYDGIDPQGGTPHQTVNAQMSIHIWTSLEDVRDSDATTNNPRQYNERAAQEIVRIVKDNAERPTNPRTGNQPVQFLAPGLGRPVREQKQRNVWHHVQNVNAHYSRD